MGLGGVAVMGGLRTAALGSDEWGKRGNLADLCDPNQRSRPRALILHGAAVILTQNKGQSANKIEATAMHDHDMHVGSPLAVVICTYCSADVILECLDSLHATAGAAVHVAICDNGSTDDTVAVVRDWATRHDVTLGHAKAGDQASLDTDLSWLTVITSDLNLGFSGGVNFGLHWFLTRTEIDLFWVLNPDSAVEPGTAAAYADCAAQAGPFALMGGRTCYLAAPGYVQSDGGRVRSGTGGVCMNVNQGLLPQDATPPAALTLQFVSGANLVASRQFLETVGLMREDYFLYYEEVDWAFRRGNLPLITCPEAVVHHHGGTVIGSGAVDRRPSAFANYFNFRNRMLFVARFAWYMLPVTYAISMAQLVKMALKGGVSEALSGMRGVHYLPPPRSVADRIAPEVAGLAFGRWGRNHTRKMR